VNSPNSVGANTARIKLPAGQDIELELAAEVLMVAERMPDSGD
jgi:hypothetical protein